MRRGGTKVTPNFPCSFAAAGLLREKLCCGCVILSSNELDFVIGVCYYRSVLRKENQMEVALLVTIIICAFIFVVFVKSQQFAHARAQAEAERQKKASKQKQVIVVYVDSETGEVIGTGKEA